MPCLVLVANIVEICKMKTIHLQKISIYGITLFLILFSLFTIKTNAFKTNTNILSFGVTADLLFFIPLIYYLVIRKTKISNKSVSLLLTVNLLLATVFIPKQNQIYLDFFKNWLLPILELLLIASLIYSVKKAIKNRKDIQKNTDFFSLLKQVTLQIVPKKMAIPLATEIAVFYYGFISWRKKKLAKNEFSYHKNSGIITILIGFIISGVIEIFVLHKILLKWNETAAWILTILSIYTIIQIYGIIRALPKRPICIDTNGIHLKYSILNEVFIHYDNLKNIDFYTKEIDKNGTLKHFSPFGKLTGNNIKIELKNEQTTIGFYGIKQKIKSIVLYIDNPSEFIKQIENNIN